MAALNPAIPPPTMTTRRLLAFIFSPFTRSAFSQAFPQPRAILQQEPELS